MGQRFGQLDLIELFFKSDYQLLDMTYIVLVLFTLCFDCFHPCDIDGHLLGVGMATAMVVA